MRKKLKTRVVMLKLTEEDYQKIILQAGQYRTLTEVITENIRGGYYWKFKTNDIPDMSIKSNVEIVDQIRNQANKNNEIDIEELNRMKQAFIERRGKKQ